MAGKRQIEVLFGPEGEVVIEAVGFKGKGCKQATKFLEDALGKSIDVKQKVEWHMVNAGNIQKTKRFVRNPSNLCG